MNDEKIKEAAREYRDNKIHSLLDDHFDAFIAGAISNSAKEYWQRGMYSEEEFKLLSRESYYRGGNDQLDRDRNGVDKLPDMMFESWYNQNKKK